ncbi:MAG: hypothetical protein J6O49_01480 [Bacteroidaceae bacterium]|nr:hypothetical protein [Bacteroidaceae bacterium]
MPKELNLDKGKRAERKSLLTVAEWFEYTVLTTEPDDWSTGYASYYKKENGVYIALTSAETFATNKYYSKAENREILGARVEDSSIELNAEIETMTDILGITYTDVNKTEPQQTLDPSNVIGGSKISAYLYDAVIHNRITDYNQAFNVYIISAFMGDATNGYETVRHDGCSIIPTSIGGSAYVQMPLEIHFSNNITSGTVNKLADDFTFTPDVTV